MNTRLGKRSANRGSVRRVRARGPLRQRHGGSTAYPAHASAGAAAALARLPQHHIVHALLRGEKARDDEMGPGPGPGAIPEDVVVVGGIAIYAE